eukprot:GFKZ01011435.1.p1 GENE.GFKZ01011435.1~~GFKZ01011435.1.p1  ORF type:complete len:519 (+),score=48.51 GFKZ01011435.1:150-1706(+)
MGNDDLSSSAANSADHETQMRVTPEEQRALVSHERNPRNEYPYSFRVSYSREEGTCGSIVAPVFVVVLAFVGIAVYFYVSFYYPSGGTMAQDESVKDICAPTILVSIDGFRYEYLSRKNSAPGEDGEPLAPNIYAIADQGVYAEGGMQPVFPTVTFPNHWSLVTGLFPEYHGIVGNTMYDPVAKSWFHLNRMQPDWWHGTPIWQTLRQSPRVVYSRDGERATLDQNYSTACVFWPGSDVPKHAPNVFWEYDGSVPYRRRIDRALSLLSGNANDLDRAANFVTLYFEGVDHAGHEYGPDSKEVEHEIRRVDEGIGYLLKRLGENASENFNLVIVSDHGMAELSPDRVVELDSSIAQGAVQDVVVSPVGLFLNMTVSAEEMYANISEAVKSQGNHARVFRKEQLPERWHLKESRLITEVVTLTDIGWTMSFPHQHLVPDTDKPMERAVMRTHGRSGSHGFDNTLKDMQAMFVATGPAFKKGVGVKGLRSVDLYEMFCHMFGVAPAPNNGSLDVTRSSILV